LIFYSILTCVFYCTVFCKKCNSYSLRKKDMKRWIIFMIKIITLKIDWLEENVKWNIPVKVVSQRKIKNNIFSKVKKKVLSFKFKKKKIE